VALVMSVIMCVFAFAFAFQIEHRCMIQTWKQNLSVQMQNDVCMFVFRISLCSLWVIMFCYVLQWSPKTTLPFRWWLQCMCLVRSAFVCSREWHTAVIPSGPKTGHFNSSYTDSMA